MRAYLLLAALLLSAPVHASTADEQINEQLNAPAKAPIAVRNDVAQPGEPIVTKRYWKIKKGAFPEFLAASRDGVWPFFEKIGARVIGMWQVIHPEGEAPADYDEVYLVTQYASVDHWRATRDMSGLGGNGPDWEAAREALRLRRSLTIETSVEFLQGLKWDTPPYYMPGVSE